MSKWSHILVWVYMPHVWWAGHKSKANRRDSETHAAMGFERALLYSAPRFSFSSVHGFEPASASDAEFGLARYLPLLYFSFLQKLPTYFLTYSFIWVQNSTLVFTGFHVCSKFWTSLVFVSLNLTLWSMWVDQTYVLIFQSALVSFEFGFWLMVGY